MLSGARSRQGGLTLTELMIASLLGLLVIAGATRLYITNIRAAADSLQASRLNQDLRGHLDRLVRDLRRSGYWAGEPGVDRTYRNPFQTPANDLRVGRHPAERAGSCVLYSYDLNADKQVGVGPSGRAVARHNRDNLEQFGLRLRAGRLQARHGGRGYDCGTGVWQTVSDPDTEITHLRFESQADCLNLADSAQACRAGAPALLRRRVRIEAVARSRSDSSITHQLNTEVALANDKLLQTHP